MTRRTVEVRCGHEGCTHVSRYEVTNRERELDIWAREGNGKHRCLRHKRPEIVMSPEARMKTARLVATRLFSDGCDLGLFWGANAGLARGPGFMAWAEDFPEGATLEVTATITLPPACVSKGTRNSPS